MRLLAPHQRREEHQEIDDPDDRQPEVGVPFGFGIFLAVGNSEEIAGAGDDDEEIVAEHHEPRRELARETRAAGALHDVERSREQDVAAEGEDHRRGVQRTQSAEVEPRREVQRGKGEFERDVDADRHAREAPEQGGDRGELDRAEIVVGLAVDLARRRFGRPIVVAIEDGEDAARGREHAEAHVEGVGRLDRLGGAVDAPQGEGRENDDQTYFAGSKRLARRNRCHDAPCALSRSLLGKLDERRWLALMQINLEAQRGSDRRTIPFGRQGECVSC